MTYYETRESKFQSYLGLGTTALIAALFGVMIGSTLSLPQSDDVPSTKASTLPDWHGNVKRSSVR
ncbi:hypothetical protein [Cognatishimia maritima]|uniref:Uncharacterized protein n=1 Tax=Cognatishimia maritima TaxID=870908 RepID=A0A1M5JQG6_9RHOB|nr:hypothetical protein [Cognatishimia maritima]SHG42807.1 hypothetical protein SAMN04488044_0752 [Cognatishimia maritima]